MSAVPARPPSNLFVAINSISSRQGYRYQLPRSGLDRCVNNCLHCHALRYTPLPQLVDLLRWVVFSKWPFYCIKYVGLGTTCRLPTRVYWQAAGKVESTIRLTSWGNYGRLDHWDQDKRQRASRSSCPACLFSYFACAGWVRTGRSIGCDFNAHHLQPTDLYLADFSCRSCRRSSRSSLTGPARAPRC